MQIAAQVPPQDCERGAKPLEQDRLRVRTALLGTSKKNCIDAAGSGHEVVQAVRTRRGVMDQFAAAVATRVRHVRHAFYGRSSHRIEDEDFITVGIFQYLHGRFRVWTRRRRRDECRARVAARALLGGLSRRVIFAMVGAGVGFNEFLVGVVVLLFGLLVRYVVEGPAARRATLPT